MHKTNKKRSIKQFLKVILSAAMVFTSLSVTNIQAETLPTDQRDLYPDMGNYLVNPNLKYSYADTKINGWKLYATNNLDYGSTEVEKNQSADASLYFKFVKPVGKTDIDEFHGYSIFKENPDGTTFKTLSMRDSHNEHMSFDRAFIAVTQTVKLEAGKKYYFRVEMNSNFAPSEGELVINRLSEPNKKVFFQRFTAPTTVKDGGKYFSTLEFTPDEALAGEATVSVRHYVDQKTTVIGEDASELRIYRIGVFAEEDYLIREGINNLYTDSTHTAFKDNTIADVQAKIDAIQNKLTTPGLIHPEVATFITGELKKANDLLDVAKAIDKSIVDKYENYDERELKEGLTQDAINQIKDKIVHITSPGIKNELEKKVTELQRVYDLELAKPIYKGEVSAKGEEVKTAIDAMPNLTEKEKEDAKKIVDDLVKEGHTNIDISKTDGEATLERDLAIKDIQDVLTQTTIQDAKNNAIKELEKKSADAAKEIDLLANLSAEQSKDAKLAIEQLLTDGKAAITASKDTGEVKENLDSYKAKMDDVVTTTTLLNEKNKANSDLDLAAQTLKNKIDTLSYLSDDEKAAFKTEVDAIVLEGKTAINAATSIDDIHEQLTLAKDKLNLLEKNAILSNSKNDYVARINEKADSILKGFDNYTALTTEELNTFKTEVESTRVSAIDAINAVTTLDDLAGVYGTEVNKLNDVNRRAEVQNAKNDEKASINKKLDELTIAINGLTAVSDKEKQDAISTLTTIKESGFTKIDALDSSTEIRQSGSDTRDEMDNVFAAISGKNATNLEDAKTLAKGDIDKEAADAKAKIDALTNLSKKEKDAFKSQVDGIATAAKKAIDEATTPLKIESVKAQGIADIQKVVVDAKLADAKLDAVAQLKAKAEEVKTAIKAKPSLTKEQINEANDEIAKTLDEAIKRVEASSTDAILKDDLKQGIDELNAIEAKYQAKDEDNFNEKKEEAKKDLDKKAEDAKKEIEDLPNLTPVEKEKAKDAVDKIVEDAKKDIDDAKTPTDVDKIVDDAKKDIDKVVDQAKLDDEKNLAIKEIEAKAKAINEAIDALEGVSLDEKTRAHNEIEQALITAKTNIIAANDSATIQKSLNDGKTEMDNIYNAISKQSETAIKDAKTKAKADIDKKADEAKKIIDALPDLSKEDKNKAKSDIDTIVVETKKNVDDALTPNAIDKLVEDTSSAIDKVVDQARLDDAKAHAVKELEAKAKDVNKAIDKLPGVSQDAKDKAKEEVNAILDNAKKDVAKANDTTTINNAVVDGKAKMDEVYNKLEKESDITIDNAKKNAKGDIDKEAKEAKEKIDAMAYLSTTQKDAYKARVDEYANTAKTKIDAVDTIEEIQAEKETGIKAIQEVVTTANFENERLGAVSKLETKASEVSSIIKKMPSLTATQLADAALEIKDTLANGSTRVKATDSLTTLPTDLQTGISELEAIVVKYQKLDDENLEKEKEDAKKDIDKKAEDAKKEIDQLPNLSQEDKDVEKGKIDKIVEDAKKDIDTSKTPDEIKKVVEDTTKLIDDTVAHATLEDEKALAIKELEAKATAVSKAIDELPGVNQEAKDKAKTEIQTILTKSKAEVTAAIDSATISKVVVDGKAAMDDVYNNIAKDSDTNIEEAKKNAKGDIDKEAAEAKRQIDEMQFLNKELKDYYKGEVDTIAKNAKDAIDTASTPVEISDAKDKGINEIKQVVKDASFDNAKHEAIVKLEEKAEEVRVTINGKLSLSDKQKQDASDEIDKTLTDAISRIDKTESMTTLPVDLQTGIDELSAIEAKYKAIDETNFEKEKEEAKKEIDKKAEEAKEEIDKLPDLSPEDKEKEKEKVDKIVDDAKKDIDDAKTPSDVDKTVDDTKKTIDDVVDHAKLEDAKAKAIKELEAKAEAINKAIDELVGVDQNAKNKAKSEVNDILSASKDNVVKADDIATINKAVVDGKAKMDDVYNAIAKDSEQGIKDLQDKAKDAIDKKAEEAKKEIDKLPDLSKEDKQKAKDAIDKVVEDAKKDVDNSTTPEQIEKVVDETTTTIDKVVDKAKLDDEKARAIKELEAKANDINKAIDALPGVSQESKDKAHEAIKDILNQAKTDVLTSTTSDAITKVVVDGKVKMDDVYNALEKESTQTIDDAKTIAKGNIDKEAAEAKKKIDAMKDLTSELKTSYKATVDSIASSAKEKIDDAKVIEEIHEIKTKGIHDIAETVSAASFDNAKLESIRLLGQKAQEVRTAINNMPSLTKEQIAKANEEIDKTLATAILRVEKTNDMRTLPTDFSTGIQELEAIRVKYKALDDENFEKDKETAKHEIDDKGEKAKEEIDKLPNLTPDEKEKAKDLIDKIVDDAKKSIDDAKVPTEVVTIVDQADKDITKVVDNAKLDDEKNVAIKELEKVAEKLKKEINDMNDLSSEEKAKAIKEIDVELSKAIENVKLSKDSSKILKAKETGIKNMENVVNQIKNRQKPIVTGVSTVAAGTSLLGLIASAAVLIEILRRRRKSSKMN